MPEEDDADEEEAPANPNAAEAKPLKPLPRPQPAEDIQLKKALELLRGNATAARAA